MSILLDDRRYTAKKQHQCNVCWEPIEPGQRYRRQRSIYDGEPATWKAHQLCDEAYAEAHRKLELYDDETPDFEEDIKPILTRMLIESGGRHDSR